MSISKAEALTLFHQQYPPETVYGIKVTDTLPVPSYAKKENCWFVLFLEDPIPCCLKGSRVVAISKITGEIVCDGVANDEG